MCFFTAFFTHFFNGASLRRSAVHHRFASLPYRTADRLRVGLLRAPLRSGPAFVPPAWLNPPYPLRREHTRAWSWQRTKHQPTLQPPPRKRPRCQRQNRIYVSRIRVQLTIVVVHTCTSFGFHRRPRRFAPAFGTDAPRTRFARLVAFATSRGRARFARLPRSFGLALHAPLSPCLWSSPGPYITALTLDPS